MASSIRREENNIWVTARAQISPASLTLPWLLWFVLLSQPPAFSCSPLPSQSAPCVMPSKFCGARYSNIFDGMVEKDPEFGACVKEFRVGCFSPSLFARYLVILQDTRTGKFCLEMYERHR
eukprot:763423-Hanusia_phi.AAC.1